MPKERSQSIDLIIFVMGFIGVCVTILLQYVGLYGVKYLPCPLCILQRLTLLIFVIIVGLGILWTTKQQYARWISLVFSISGIALAIRQILIQKKPSSSCGFDPIERFINEWLVNSYTKWFFKVESNCFDNTATLFGLSIPIWSLSIFSVLTLLTILQILRKRFFLN
jgi:disulfide bond formation protein DsbB